MRINKYIASLTKYSRRQVDDLISKGKVRLNDKNLNKNNLGLQIDPEKDKVFFNNKLLKTKVQKSIYLALNKPKGFITTKTSQKNQKIVFDLIPKNLNVFAVGRLDKNSQGLLIFTNDGELTLELTHPKFNHEKEYIIKTREKITEKQLTKLNKGIILEEGLAKAKKIVKINEYELKIILTTGFKRQIRRMVKAVGNKVTDLKRVRINKFQLNSLPVGKWKYISKQDLV